MRPLALMLGLFLAAPTHAAEWHGEISVDLGLLANRDQAWDFFGESDVMASAGARVGYALDKKVTFVLGWQHYGRGSSVLVPKRNDWHESFRAAFSGDALTLGPKVGTLLGNAIYPYVTTQAVAFLGRIRLDDDPTIRHNPGQLREVAITPGVLGMVGLEARVPINDTLSVAFHTEGGYEWLARGTYGAFGSMRPGGLAIRSGVGLRF